MNQLHIQEALLPNKTEDMSNLERKKALNSNSNQAKLLHDNWGKRMCYQKNPKRVSNENNNKFSYSFARANADLMHNRYTWGVLSGRKWYSYSGSIPTCQYGQKSTYFTWRHHSRADNNDSTKPASKNLWYNKNGKLMIGTTFALFYVMLQPSLLFWKFLSKSLHDHT